MQSDFHLTADAFRDALCKGLGRAVLHVRKHGCSGVEQHILDACLHDLAYDAQCEGNRAPWLYPILCLCKDKKPFRDAILESLQAATEHYDAGQLFALARFFAKEGDAAARSAIYEKFNRQRYWI